jgi:hypothetical protein
MEFDNEPNAIAPSDATNFVDLLTEIREHLCESKETRNIYVEMSKMFFDSLPADIQRASKIATDADFKSYIEQCWPLIKTFTFNPTPGAKFRWGYVQKGCNNPHIIHILSDIVLSAEKAVSTCILSYEREPDLFRMQAKVNGTSTKMEIQEYNLIITVIVMHELAHSFTKFWFDEAVTPLGVGVGNCPNDGESGWLVEENLMHGVLEAQWNDPKQVYNMDLIDCVILRNATNNKPEWFRVCSKFFNIPFRNYTLNVVSFSSSRNCQGCFIIAPYSSFPPASQRSDGRPKPANSCHPCKSHQSHRYPT